MLKGYNKAKKAKKIEKRANNREPRGRTTEKLHRRATDGGMGF